MSFLFKQPDIKPPKAPAAPPTEANSSVQEAGLPSSGYSSLISTGPGGLKRKASTAKASLIGGA